MIYKKHIIIILCITVLIITIHRTLPPITLFTTPATPTVSSKQLLNNFTLDQKIGQLFMVSAISNEKLNKKLMQKKPYRMDKNYVTELIKKYHIGGIIYKGVSSPEQQAELTAYYQNISATPLLVGQDLEPGRLISARFPTLPSFPSAMELGSIEDEQIIYNIGKEIGTFCKKVGVNINFAPVADVNNNEHNTVIGDRSFGENPNQVAQKATAFMRGLQDAGVLSCTKHFPGHGDTSVDSHYALPHIPHDRKRLDDVELYPFKKLIKNNINAIMTTHLYVPALEPKKDTPTSLSYNVITNLLRNELEFKGLIITDALDGQAVRATNRPGKTRLEGRRPPRPSGVPGQLRLVPPICRPGARRGSRPEDGHGSHHRTVVRRHSAAEPVDHRWLRILSRANG